MNIPDPNDHRERDRVYTLGRIYILAFFSVFFSLPPSSQYRVHASISTTVSPWDQSWNFQSSMVQASGDLGGGGRIKLTKESRRRGVGTVAILLATFISAFPFYFFPPLRIFSTGHDFSNLSKRSFETGADCDGKDSGRRDTRRHSLEI